MNINDHHGSSQREKPSGEALTHHEIDRIIATANANPETSLTGAVVKVLADTGMRIGELVNLKVSDIDEQAGVICIASLCAWAARPLTCSVRIVGTPSTFSVTLQQGVCAVSPGSSRKSPRDWALLRVLCTACVSRLGPLW